MGIIAGYIRRRIEKYKKYYDAPVQYAGIIKRRAKELYGLHNRVFLFGSIIKGNYTYSSDIDVLIVVRGNFTRSEKSEAEWYVKQDFEPCSPFNIIICSPEQYEKWYGKYILDKYLEIR